MKTETWRAFYNQRRAASQIPEFIMESEEQRPVGKNQERGDLLQICIFRRKTTAYKKVHWTRYPLTQCVDLRADSSIALKLLLLQLMAQLLTLHLMIW